MTWNRSDICSDEGRTSTKSKEAKRLNKKVEQGIERKARGREEQGRRISEKTKLKV